MIAVFGRSTLGYWPQGVESPPVLPKLWFWYSRGDQGIGLGGSVANRVRYKGFASVRSTARLQMVCVNEKVDNVGDLGRDGSDLNDNSTNGHVVVAGIFVFLGTPVL